MPNHPGDRQATQSASPLHVGQVLEFHFENFTPRITIHSERELTVDVIEGNYIGSPTQSSMKPWPFEMTWSCFRGRNTMEAQSCTCSISAQAPHTQL
jgi:hypothetical protein